MDRRSFLAMGGCGVAGAAAALGAEQKSPPSAPDHSLTVISGGPHQRGFEYGKIFKRGIRDFLQKEIYEAFAKNPPGREDLLSYSSRCIPEIKSYSPLVFQELEGVAEGSGLPLNEVVLITLHEELWHKGIIPPVSHCTAVAAGPPDTGDGHTYVGQNWDWMGRLYGLSSVLLWERSEGPAVLTYSYPGLWAGAGMNSAGVALVWTSTLNPMKIPGPRVGIPSYVLIAHLLYQPTLDAAVAEARRAKQAGWFTLVLADSRGNIANIEGSPDEMEIQTARGHMARTYYGTPRMSRTPPGEKVKNHPQVDRMWNLLDGAAGRLDLRTIQGFFGDHESTICKHFGTLDSMVFDTTARAAYVSRGPGCSGRWVRFTFDSRQTARADGMPGAHQEPA